MPRGKHMPTLAKDPRIADSWDPPTLVTTLTATLGIFQGIHIYMFLHLYVYVFYIYIYLYWIYPQPSNNGK